MDGKTVIYEKTLIMNGFVYARSGLPKKSNTYWECRYLRRKECTARVTTTIVNNEIVVLRETDHDHPPNKEEAQAEIHKQALKRRAENPEAGLPSLMIRTELAGVSAGVLAHLPETENLAKTIRRVKRINLPPNPKSILELGVVPEEYQKTLSGDKFLFYDSSHDELALNIDLDAGQRVLAFGTRRNIEILATSNTWYLDGTFKVQYCVHTYKPQL